MNFTIPNLLSLARMGLVPFFMIAVLDGKPRQALILFLVAGLTDACDGAIARLTNQQSRLGAYLDPMADKLLLMSAYASLSIPGLNPGFRIPFWVTVLVIARDVVIVVVSVVLYLALEIQRFPPAKISKVTTAVQVITVLLVLVAGMSARFEMAALTACYLVAALTVASGLNYIYLANRLAAAKGAAPGDAP
jgi:cardiolipin synthase (CMP-forming)